MTTMTEVYNGLYLLYLESSAGYVHECLVDASLAAAVTCLGVALSLVFVWLLKKARASSSPPMFEDGYWVGISVSALAAVMALGMMLFNLSSAAVAHYEPARWAAQRAANVLRTGL